MSNLEGELGSTNTQLDDVNMKLVSALFFNTLFLVFSVVLLGLHTQIHYVYD